MFKIHSDNCLQVMKSMDAQSIDCVITDPPFNGFDLRGTSQTYWYSFADAKRRLEEAEKNMENKGY